MPQVTFPADYNQVMPYLIIKDAAGFMSFAAQVFGATERMKHMRDEHIIMHGEIAIGTSVIMFAEATDQFSACNAGLFVYISDADAACAKALQLGATVVTPISNQPYGRSGGILDSYGNTWWITTHIG